jgi:hypothetical protein
MYRIIDIKCFVSENRYLFIEVIVYPILEIRYTFPGGENVMCGTYYRGHGGRHFLTTEEKIERLEEYKSWLDNESKGVEEAIEQLKKAS